MGNSHSSQDRGAGGLQVFVHRPSEEQGSRGSPGEGEIHEIDMNTPSGTSVSGGGSSFNSSADGGGGIKKNEKRKRMRHNSLLPRLVEGSNLQSIGAHAEQSSMYYRSKDAAKNWLSRYKEECRGRKVKPDKTVLSYFECAISAHSHSGHGGSWRKILSSHLHHHHHVYDSHYEVEFDSGHNSSTNSFSNSNPAISEAHELPNSDREREPSIRMDAKKRSAAIRRMSEQTSVEHFIEADSALIGFGNRLGCGRDDGHVTSGHKMFDSFKGNGSKSAKSSVKPDSFDFEHKHEFSVMFTSISGHISFSGLVFHRAVDFDILLSILEAEISYAENVSPALSRSPNDEQSPQNDKENNAKEGVENINGDPDSSREKISFRIGEGEEEIDTETEANESNHKRNASLSVPNDSSSKRGSTDSCVSSGVISGSIDSMSSGAPYLLTSLSLRGCFKECPEGPICLERLLQFFRGPNAGHLQSLDVGDNSGFFPAIRCKQSGNINLQVEDVYIKKGIELIDYIAESKTILAVGLDANWSKDPKENLAVERLSKLVLRTNPPIQTISFGFRIVRATIDATNEGCAHPHIVQFLSHFVPNIESFLALHSHTGSIKWGDGYHHRVSNHPPRFQRSISGSGQVKSKSHHIPPNNSFDCLKDSDKMPQLDHSSVSKSRHNIDSGRRRSCSNDLAKYASSGHRKGKPGGLSEKSSSPTGTPDSGNMPRKSSSTNLVSASTESLMLNIAPVKKQNMVTSLRLERCELDREMCLILEDAIKNCKQLKGLSLPHNPLKPEGFASLAKGLAQNATLQALDLYGCQGGKVGTTALLRVIASHPRLRLLDLGLNAAGNEGGLALAVAIEETRSLRSIAFANNLIGDSADKVARAVLVRSKNLANAENKFYSGLKKLDLSGNIIQDGCVDSFVELIENNTSLKTLNLNSNQLHGKSSSRLCMAMFKNHTLLNFFLKKNNNVHSHDVANLDEILRNNRVAALARANEGGTSGPN
eukprot:Nk52_evm4s675 gene=Nk52_evmTU4s675